MGIGEFHEQKVRLPIVNISSACNLECPICFVHNKNTNAFNMGIGEFKQILGHLVESHGRELDLINFTGGEPTMHPDFLEFIKASHEAGIHRVTICTNGIKLVEDESMVRRIAEVGGRVALSLDTFEKEADFKMQGAHLVKMKLRCLDLLEKYDVNTTLIPVVTRGYNDHEVGKMIELTLARPNIRHIEFHTITYTGQGGTTFDRSGRISIYEVLERARDQTNGWVTPADFVPSPCAHSLCYQIVYVLMDPEGGRPIPFTRFMDRKEMYEALSDRLYLEPNARLEAALHGAVDRLWSGGSPDSERILRAIKGLLGQIFPKGRSLTREEALRASERAVKAIYVHSHMDEENFDTQRAAQCCDSDCFADGTSVPVCNYNVLYRDKQPEFNVKPQAWHERKGGQMSFEKPGA